MPLKLKKDGQPRKPSIHMGMTRKDDEKLLIWLKLRRMGVAPTRIAEASGTVVSIVCRTTMRVLDADLEESSDEDPDQVRAAYWQPGRGEW